MFQQPMLDFMQGLTQSLRPFRSSMHCLAKGSLTLIAGLAAGMATIRLGAPSLGSGLIVLSAVVAAGYFMAGWIVMIRALTRRGNAE